MSSEDARERIPAVAAVELGMALANRMLSRVGVLSLLVVGEAVGVEWKSSWEIGDDGWETPRDTSPLSMEVLKLLELQNMRWLFLRGRNGKRNRTHTLGGFPRYFSMLTGSEVAWLSSSSNGIPCSSSFSTFCSS